jgi:phosphopantetheine--protein transferase-like protein
VINWMLCRVDETWPWWQGDARPDFLSPAEAERLAGMKFHKRRREWLLGRYVAKSLLRACVPGLSERSAHEITIKNEPSGAPYFVVDGIGRYPASISISHRESMAACALALGTDGQVGIDLERIEERSQEFVEDFFTAGEVRTSLICPADCRDTWVTLVWSAKEAVLKALGLGLSVDSRSVEIVLADGLESSRAQKSDPACEPGIVRNIPGSPEADGWLALEIYSTLPEANGVQAWWRRCGQYAVTLALKT